MKEILSMHLEKEPTCFGLHFGGSFFHFSRDWLCWLSYCKKSSKKLFYWLTISAPTKVLDKMLNCDPTDWWVLQEMHILLSNQCSLSHFPDILNLNSWYFWTRDLNFWSNRRITEEQYITFSKILHSAFPIKPSLIQRSSSFLPTPGCPSD